MVREIYENELSKLLNLYLCLHEKSVPEMTEHLKTTWETIIKDKNHHIIVNEADNKIVSSCVCVIENVVTRKDCRGRGYAAECLNYAKEIAKMENCYKMMLLTGSKEESILKFYRSAGYNSSDKTAFIQWLE